ncbi:MAG: AEC family transporter [Hyphomonadaceae bacterium]|nr:AEC family transporter [Hyphomonadaceae bacterium]
MLDVVLSLVPVFSLIALGAVLRGRKLLSVDGWAALERLTYFVLFPPLMFMSIVEGSFAGEEALKLGLALAGTVITMAAFMLLIRPILPATGAQFSSIFQAGVRWNGYVALGVIAGLHGEEGVALSAVGFAVLVPINNVMSVLVLSRYAGSAPAPFRHVLQSVATNPLIISTVLAIVLVRLGVRVSEPVGDTLNLLGDATVSLGLICVGAALDFGSMRATPAPLAIGTILRLGVMPAVAAGMCFAIGMSDMSFEVAMICVAAPAATSAYILARQLGGDATLMANIITLTTLLSLVTIPLTLFLAQFLTG